MSSVIDSSALRMEMRRTVQRMSERGRKGRDKKGILSGCMHAHTLMYLTKETIGEKKRKRAIRTTRKSTAVGEEKSSCGVLSRARTGDGCGAVTYYTYT